MFNLLSLKTTNLKKKKPSFISLGTNSKDHTIMSQNTTQLKCEYPSPQVHQTMPHHATDLRLFLQSHRFIVLYHTKSFEEELRAQKITQNLQVSFFLSFCK